MQPSGTVLSADPEPREAILEKANSLIQAGRIPEALPVIQELVDFDVRDAEAWCLVAQAWHTWGHGDKGLHAAELALQADPSLLSGHIWKCRNLLALDQKQPALDAARHAMTVTGQSPEVHRLLVDALIANERIPEAEANLASLLARFPDDPELVSRAGKIHFAKNDFAAAEAAFSSVLTTASEPADTWSWLGATWMRLENIPEAVPCYYRAAVAAPNVMGYRHNFVELIDGLYRQNLDHFRIFFVFVGIATIAGASAIQPLAFFPALAGVIWGWKAGCRWVVNSKLRPYAPEIGDYFRAQKPIVARESASSLWFAWFLLLLIGGLIAGASGFTQRGEWLVVGMALSILVPPVVWIWIWKSRSPQVSLSDAAYFWFPDEDTTEILKQIAEPSELSDPVHNTRKLMQCRRWAAARRTAARAVAADPENLGSQQVYSLALLAAGEAAAGLVAAERLRTLAPHDPASWALVWIQYASGDRQTQALEEARERPEMMEAARRTYFGFLQDLVQAGAVNAVDKATALLAQLAPHSAEVRGLEGDAAMRDNRWKEAETAYRQAHKLDPENPEFLNGLGCVAFARKQYFQARNHWRRAIAVAPEHRLLADNLGLLVAYGATFSGYAVGAGVLLLGLIPTFRGQARNDWMLWATLAAPCLAGAASIPLRRIVMTLLFPHLPAKAADKVAARASGLSFVTTLHTAVGALCVHGLQAWAEILIHPDLLPVRWKGAATVSVLAIYAIAAIVNAYRSIANERARTLSLINGEG